MNEKDDYMQQQARLLVIRAQDRMWDILTCGQGKDATCSVPHVVSWIKREGQYVYPQREDQSDEEYEEYVVKLFHHIYHCSLISALNDLRPAMRDIVWRKRANDNGYTWSYFARQEEKQNENG